MKHKSHMMNKVINFIKYAKLISNLLTGDKIDFLKKNN